MPESAWTTPPIFNNGDTLSASLINVLLTDLDILVGWQYSPRWPMETSGYPVTALGDDQDVVWRGWAVLRGDRLLARVTGNGTLQVYFDDVLIGTINQAEGEKTFMLDLAGQGWQQWNVYKVEFKEIDAANVPTVMYAYLTGPIYEYTGGIAFNGGTLSDEADFEKICTAIGRSDDDGFRSNLRQPVTGARLGLRLHPQDLDDSWQLLWEVMVRKTHSYLRIRGVLQSPTDADGIGGAPPTRVRLVAQLRVERPGESELAITSEDDENWWATLNREDPPPPAPPYPPTQTVNMDRLVAQPYYNAGDWYYLRLYARCFDTTNQISNIHRIGEYVRLDDVHEEHNQAVGGWPATTRFQHGDYTAPTSGPSLFNLDSAVSTLNGVRGRYCPVQREPMLDDSWYLAPLNPLDPSTNVIQAKEQRFYQMRIWRYLVYHSWWESSDDDEINAVLYWNDGSNLEAWQAITLPVRNGLDVYDLSKSPVAIGMLFYVTGVRYAIQSPEIPPDAQA